MWKVSTLLCGTVVGMVSVFSIAYWQNLPATSDIASATTFSSSTVVEMEKQPTLIGWQSSYIDGKMKVMEPIKQPMTWKRRIEDSSLPTSVIRVDATTQYQEILGFGGAFTEAAALQFAKLPPHKQEEVLTLYFDKADGSGYEFGCVPMGSCDFFVASYSFDAIVDDTTLSHFDMNVTHDTETMIPFIQRAMKKNPQLKLFLSPWSPPAWMKSPNADGERSILGSAIPKGLDDAIPQTWALYFSKFITAYKQHNIPFWGLTPQNEPEAAGVWEACLFTAESEMEFIANYLGPVIKRDHPNVKIIVCDYLRISVLEWAKTAFTDPHARKYIDGIGIHWYTGWFLDRPQYMDGVDFHENLNDTHYVDESRFILSTEAANCPGVATGDLAWFRGQRYAHDIINDFNNWVVGWVDWNLILDHQGGPNHAGNMCDAPIIVDETGQDFIIQPMYYFIQHFSKYVPTGSRRVHSEVAVVFKEPGDPDVHLHYPVELRNCDGSSRQLVDFIEDGKLQISGTEYCIDLIDPEVYTVVRSKLQNHQVELAKCQDVTKP